jgi:hypothetical protein
MGLPSPPPGPAAKYLQSTTVDGTVTVTVTLPAGEAGSNLIVLDGILWTGQSSAAGALTITVNSVVVARKQLAGTAAPEYGQIDFSAGWPLWSASGADTTPLGATDVVLTGPATLSNACLTVTFHYIAAGELRN